MFSICARGNFWTPRKGTLPLCVENELERVMHFLVAMEEKPVRFQERSFLFARDVVAFARKVAEHGFIFRRLAGQLVDAGSSVGANLEESTSAQTKPDFITKQCIALKEAREARFWLRLIAVSEPGLAPRAEPLIAEASEFVAMLTTSIKTARSRPNRGGVN